MAGSGSGRSGSSRSAGGVASKPSRLNRSEADQAVRDQYAQQLKRLDKGVRRAIGTATYGRGHQNEWAPFGRNSQAQAINSTTHLIRNHIRELGVALARNRDPLLGRKALSRQDRAAMTAEIKATAQSLRGRLAAVAYGGRLGGRRSTVKRRKA